MLTTHNHAVLDAEADVRPMTGGVLWPTGPPAGGLDLASRAVGPSERLGTASSRRDGQPLNEVIGPGWRQQWRVLCRTAPVCPAHSEEVASLTRNASATQPVQGSNVDPRLALVRRSRRLSTGGPWNRTGVVRRRSHGTSTLSW